MCLDTDFMLLHFVSAQSADVWTISGTAKKQKYYQVYAETYATSEGYTADTTSAFHGDGNRSY